MIVDVTACFNNFSYVHRHYKPSLIQINFYIRFGRLIKSKYGRLCNLWNYDGNRATVALLREWIL